MYAIRLEADEVFPKMGTKPLMCVTMEAFQNIPNQKALAKLQNLSDPKASRDIFTIRGFNNIFLYSLFYLLLISF
jgi:hypothetical protein